MASKKDKAQKAAARHQAEQARKETEKLIDRFMKGKNISLNGGLVCKM